MYRITGWKIQTEIFIWKEISEGDLRIQYVDWNAPVHYQTSYPHCITTIFPRSIQAKNGRPQKFDIILK